MIVMNNAVEAYVSSNVPTYQASISMTKEMFDLIIRGIYKDPKKAVTREYLCNARDSQVEAGVDSALIIHLPTALEPWFSVKDHGIGMSKQMVTRTFMELGNSTKRENNKLIGCKGIGSKVGLALTDSFTVISIFDGVKSSYTVYMNKGIPDIAVVSEKPTQERNGVEVKVGIESNIIHEFNQKAVEFLSFFDYPYEVNIRSVKDEAKYPTVAYSEVVDGIKVEILSDDCEEFHQDKVVMGGVAYDSYYLQYNGGENYICTIPLGMANISPGREYMEENDNPEFVQKLKVATEKAKESYYAQILSDAKSCSTIGELIEFFNKQSRVGKVLVGDEMVEEFDYSTWDRVTSYAQHRKGYNYTFCGRQADIEVYKILAGKAIIMVKDKNNNLKTRARQLKNKYDVDIIYSVDINHKILQNKFLSDLVYFSSEAELDVDKPKEKKSRVPRTGSKGHVVYYFDNSGVCKERMSKDDIADIECYILRDERYSAESFYTNRGYLGSCYRSVLNHSGKDKIYLLSERQASWNDKEDYTPEVSKEVVSVLEEELTRRTHYNDYVELLNYLRSIKGSSGRLSLKSDKSALVPRWFEFFYSDLIEKYKQKAMKAADSLVQKYKEEKEALLKSCPVLKFVDEDEWQEKEIKAYIKTTLKQTGEVNV